MYKKYLYLALAAATFATDDITEGPFRNQYNNLCQTAYKKTGGFCEKPEDMIEIARNKHRNAWMVLWGMSLLIEHYDGELSEKAIKEKIERAYDAGNQAMCIEWNALGIQKGAPISFTRESLDFVRGITLGSIQSFAGVVATAGERVACLCLFQDALKIIMVNQKQNLLGPDITTWRQFIKAAKKDNKMTVSDFEAFKAKQASCLSCLSCLVPCCLKGSWTCCLPCCKSTDDDLVLSDYKFA